MNDMYPYNPGPMGPMGPMNQNGKKKSNLLPLIIAIAAIVVIAVIALVIFILLRDKDVEEKHVKKQSHKKVEKSDGATTIEGNNINNLVNGTIFDGLADSMGTYYKAPNKNKPLISCVSKIDDTYYGICGEKAITFNVVDNEVSNVEEIPELSEIEGVFRLLVSEGYYFVYNGEYEVLSINRSNGEVKKCPIDYLYDNQFTFTETGKFCYLDWDGSGTGHEYLYYSPGDNISGEPEVYEITEVFGGGAVREEIFSGGGDIVYVYLATEGYDDNLSTLYKFDLSSGHIKKVSEIDIKAASPEIGVQTYFYCDGEDIFFESLVDEKANKSEIGILDPKKGELNCLYETNKSPYYVAVYPENKGKLAFFIGNGNISDEIVTIP